MLALLDISGENVFECSKISFSHVLKNKRSNKNQNMGDRNEFLFKNGWPMLVGLSSRSL